MVVQWWRNDAHLLVKRGIIPGRIESSVIVQGSSVREGCCCSCSDGEIDEEAVLLGARAACSHRR